MKLWLLRPNYEGTSAAWGPWYDKAFGFVIRAETERSAREIADAMGGDENFKRDSKGLKKMVNPWLDPEQSTCEELTPEGIEGMVLRDFRSA